jgi:hypothetical protein
LSRFVSFYRKESTGPHMTVETATEEAERAAWIVTMMHR